MARKHPLTILIGVLVVVLFAGTVSPAFGGPTATGGAAKAMKAAKRALGRRQAGRQALQAGAGRRGQDRSRRPARSSAGPKASTVAQGPPGHKGTTGADGAQGAHRPRRRHRPARPDRIARRHAQRLHEHRDRGHRDRPGVRSTTAAPTRRSQLPYSARDHGLRLGAGQEPRRGPRDAAAASCASATAPGPARSQRHEPDLRVRFSRTERI